MEDLGFLEELPTLLLTVADFLLSIGSVAGPGLLVSLIFSKLQKQNPHKTSGKINIGANHRSMSLMIPSFGFVQNFKNLILI
jgi:hypothetical protein